MAAVKLIKFVAVAIWFSSSDAEPTNRTCAGQDQDEMVALQVGVQSHVGTCSCGDVCPGYNGQGGGEVEFSCSEAQEAYLASNPGVDQEALSQTECYWASGPHLEKVDNTKCWSGLGSALWVTFNLPYPHGKKNSQYPCLSTCPAGFYNADEGIDCAPCAAPIPAENIRSDYLYATSMNVVCPNGWCECGGGGCGCKAQGRCR
ncbi:unnamed protein product [Polarella glacialis]|uniref:Tyrosine-protein kinase ephrin type A/B receptor-like domain-containing protein n=1 Tax=Polarella glacialis TaxID=89957 RepID=A0A813FIZ3_POLGL|nr:unnamed protein product [Polarella glacialis]